MLSLSEAAVVSRVDELAEEMVEFLQELVRIPTINPPGRYYADCAGLIGEKLRSFGYETRFVIADGLPECTAENPRVNVIGHMAGAATGPRLHFNGHLDVVPVGEGWTVDPFAGLISDGRIYGRGVTDQKAGIAASIFAVEAIRRAGVKVSGAIEQSATVDEESGGFAGVAYLASNGYLTRRTVDYVIITEPLDYDRICIGHRGVYWFEVVTHGRTAHGSMPFLGVSAIDRMARFIGRIDSELRPRLTQRITTSPVVPDGARAATINVNAIAGGQDVDSSQSPCVADLCRAVVDRRFLIEESFADVRNEISEVLEGLRREDRDFSYELKDKLIVYPTMTSPDAAVVTAMSEALLATVGRPAPLIASPGTYDQKHFARIGGIDQCIAYGPGILNLAHQPDEYCEINHLITSCKAMAVAALRLVGAVD